MGIFNQKLIDLYTIFFLHSSAPSLTSDKDVSIFQYVMLVLGTDPHRRFIGLNLKQLH